MFEVSIHGDILPNSRDVDISPGGQWVVPEEVPVAFVYNRRNYAVMMATPDDLVDFAVGFTLTEGIVKSPNDIQDMNIYLSDKGVDIRLKIQGRDLEKLDVTQRRRNMIGSASCGLCGLENADVLFRVLPTVSETRKTLKITAMEAALLALEPNQPLNESTRSVHAAAWVTDDGDIEIVREDVGRHNALDKLLGAMALSGINVNQGFVLMSSRCSYEIVEKAALRGVQAILSVSGPTAFALRKAKEANMSIYSRHMKSAVDVNL